MRASLRWGALLAASLSGSAARGQPVALIGGPGGLPLALHEGRAFALSYGADMARFEDEDARRPGGGEILFTGSSSFARWQTLLQDMAPLPVINRAFGGATSPQLWYYAERAVIARRPEIVVAYIGDNDLAQGTVTVGSYLKYVRLFVGKVRSALPEVRFVFVSNKPSVARWRYWPKYQDANRALRALCEADPRMAFVDITPTLLRPDGLMRQELFEEDMVHFRPGVYHAWARILKPVLERMWARGARR